MAKFDYFLKGINYTKDLLEKINLSMNVFLDENISSLLLIFSNLNKDDKKEAILKIYEFEKDLDINISRKEIDILNNYILKKFKKVIFLSNLYSTFYNNKFIRNVYRKLNNKSNL